MRQKPPLTGILNTINEIIENGRQKEILQLYTDDTSYNGRIISIKNKQLINFGSCGYLGLEIDERLKAAAIDAIQRYGIQYSSSRSYVSCTLYTELESLVKQIFNAHAVLTPTTTLGHQAVIPVVIKEGDIIIMDQQVHASVQYAALNMQNKGVQVTVIRHNNLNELEEAIIKHSSTSNAIWYMADGIYSMYGDYLPIHELVNLLNRYPKFNLYVDDAHGMSWTGRNGRGFVLGEVDLHPKMIVGTSFAKAFGTGGGVFLFSDEDLCRKVRNCGGPLIFSGPNQIPVIAASIASAKIHLSDEIYNLQAKLKDKILFCHQLLLEKGLPVVSNPETPIKFIGLGLTRVGYNMVKRMINSGFYCNLAIFPAVPETCTGLRFTITAHHTLNDIKKLVHTLAFHLPQALAEEGRTIVDIHRAFRKVIDLTQVKQLPEPKTKITERYRVQHETSIEFIPEKLWDSLLKKGSYDWKWLKFLEQTFTKNHKPEHNWDFHYYIIWDQEKPVLATFFTATLNKDDMLANGSVSFQLEVERLKNPYYLCSKTFMMGSLITEGQHLYIDRNNKDWKSILMMLLDTIWNEQIIQQTNSLCLRDFDAEDKELGEFLMDQGFVRMNLPNNHIINKVDWKTEEDYLKRFNARNRWYMKDNVLKYKHLFNIEIIKDATETQIDKWYELYRNVKGRSFELNTFELPRKFFVEMVKNKNCEIMQLSVKNNKGDILAVTFNLITAAQNYCGIVIGLDYNYLKTHSVYKQTLFKSLIRAGELEADKIFLGFTTTEVKKKFGATAVQQVAYFQAHDHYNLSIINSIANKGKLTETERNSFNKQREITDTSLKNK